MKNLSFLGHPQYSVSKEGLVYSLKSSKFLKSFTDTSGYHYIECYGNSKKHKFSVHRLVALCFIPNPENKKEVNHKDGDKSNNSVENLEWMTPSENCVHAERTNLRNNSTLDDETVRNICKHIEQGIRVVDIAKMFGTTKGIVSGIKNFKTYKYLSCEFDFSKVKKVEKLSDEKLIKICKMLEQGKSYTEIREATNVKNYIIGNIKRRKYYTEISNNFVW